jgi:hypothetical protein
MKRSNRGSAWLVMVMVVMTIDVFVARSLSE